MTDPTYRMSMLPFGTYPNENGQGEHLGLAVPGMIQEPVNALMRLFGSGNFAQGPDYPGNADDMRTLLFSMYGGNAMNPAGLIEKAAYRTARDPEGIARSYGQIARDKPSEALGAYELRRSPTSKGGGIKYDLFDGNDPIANLMIDAPKRLSPTMFDMAMASNFEKLERAQPIAGTITRIDVNDAHQGKGIATRLLDAAENDLRSAGATLHPGDTSMTQDFMNLYAKRDPEIMRDAFARMGIGRFDDPSLMFDRAMRSRADRTTGASTRSSETLYSDTGKPSLMGSALAGAEAPQRMYHGTGVADDFNMFRPSENGAFGPGVYLSREAESTNPYAFNGPNPRVMPVDVSGPLATYDDYLAARNASPDQAATIQALLDRGFSGVSVDNATPKGSVNVTNVFRPGSVRSATTGETLFSDGLPSLWGNALAPSQEPRNALIDYAQNDQSHMWDHRDQPPVEDYQSVLPSDMNQFRLNWMRQYRSSHPSSGPEDAYDAYLKSPEYKEKLKGSKQIPFDQIPPGEFIPHR